MEEEEISVPFRETTFWILVRAVCKRWMLIGFLTVFGALAACIYALAAMPLSKDVYQISISLNQTNATGQISYYNENNINNIKNYIQSSECKYNVYAQIEPLIFQDLNLTAEKKEDLFKKTVKVTVSPSITIYVVDQDKETGEIILDAFAGETKQYVLEMVDSMTVQINGVDVVGIVATSGKVVKTDPEEINFSGYIKQSNRIITIVAGAVIGLLIGAIIAVCIYYLNDRPNSMQMLAAAGFAPVYIDKKGKNGAYSSSAYDENTVRYRYLMEKESCRIISFICPFKTEATARAIDMQAVSMRKYGYRVLCLAQEGQTHAEWEKILEKESKDHDYILIDSLQADNYDCAIVGELSDGAVVVIDQKNTKMKAVKHVKEVMDAAGLKLLSVYIADTRDDFII